MAIAIAASRADLSIALQAQRRRAARGSLEGAGGRAAGVVFTSPSVRVQLQAAAASSSHSA